MRVFWRLVKTSRAPHAFDGEGARMYGGRWNHPGTGLVYVSESLALAALETLVHLTPGSRHLLFQSFRVEAPASLRIEELHAHSLPKDWRAEPPRDETKDIGTEWAKRGSSCVLLLPSAVVPSERNALLNPDHSEFPSLKIASTGEFSFDPRLR